MDAERPERRQRIRISKALAVAIQGEDGIFHSKNLHANGLFLLTDKRWPLGTTLSLRFFHVLLSLEVNATVVHHQADGVGLRYVSPPESFQDGMSNIINSLLADGAWFDERRRSLRTQVSGQAVYEYKGSEISAQLIDLSREGAFLESPFKPPVGDAVCFYLPRRIESQEGESTAVVGCTARVAHQKESGFGLQFQSPSAEFDEALVRILEQAQPST